MNTFSIKSRSSITHRPKKKKINGKEKKVKKKKKERIFDIFLLAILYMD